MIDYYKLLDVAKDATQAEIKKAYRKKAHVLHPDREGASEEANDEFVQMKLAYDVLKDPEKRAEYDLNGHFDPHKKSVRAGAIDALIGLFVSEVDKCNSIDVTDIKEKMKSAIYANLQALSEQRAGELARLPKYQSVLKRIKCENPVFANSMNEKIEFINGVLKRIADAEEVNKVMLEILEDFDYSFDEIVEQAMGVGTPRHFYIGTPLG